MFSIISVISLNNQVSQQQVSFTTMTIGSVSSLAVIYFPATLREAGDNNCIFLREPSGLLCRAKVPLET